jgi:hypothetical protein
MKSPFLPLGIVVAVVCLTVFLMWPARGSRVVPKDYHYMYCPSCERDWAYKAEQYQKGCERCGGPLEGARESIKAVGARPSPHGKMFAVVLLELVVGMGAVVILAGSRPGEQEVEYLYTWCAKCRQKIRYRVEQVGHQAACRRCKKRFTFPQKDANSMGGEPDERLG